MPKAANRLLLREKSDNAAFTTALTVEEASAALVTLINSRSRSPTQDEIEAVITRVTQHASVRCPTPLGAAVRQAVVDAIEAEKRAGTIPESEWQEGISAVWAQLRALEDQLPNEVRTFGDVLAIAELAWYWNTEEIPNSSRRRLFDLNAQSADARSAARLIKAVLALAGHGLEEQPAPSRSASGLAKVVASLSPLAHAMRRLRPEFHRRLCAELDADAEHGMRSPQYEASKANWHTTNREFEGLVAEAWAAPVASLHDLIPHIEAALVKAERAPNGALIGTPASDSPHPCCPFERAQMMLLLAVAQLTGCAVASDGEMHALNNGVA